MTTNIAQLESLWILLLASVVSTFSLYSTVSTVQADNPSSCTNRYDAQITSVKVDNGPKNVDAVAKSHTNIAAKLGDGYDVTFTLHTASQSSSGNKDEGQVWYGSTAYGFASDHCVKGAQPDSDITITLHNVFMGQATHGTVQPVVWYSWPLSEPFISYTVHWN